MHPKKQDYAIEAFNLMVDCCSKIAEDMQNPIPAVLNISPDDAQAIINKILIALPDRYFYSASEPVIQDMLGFIVRNYILFQVQEDIREAMYAYDLVHFISRLSSSIQSRYFFH